MSCRLPNRIKQCKEHGEGETTVVADVYLSERMHSYDAVLYWSDECYSSTLAGQRGPVSFGPITLSS